MFYAVSFPYGSRVACNTANPPTLFAFDTRKERDAWVDARWEYREEMTYKEARRHFGEPLIRDDEFVCPQCHAVTAYRDVSTREGVCDSCCIANVKARYLASLEEGDGNAI